MNMNLRSRHAIRRAVLVGTAALGMAVIASGEDWPQWRGPHRDGISRETDWHTQGQPEDVWKINVGLGYSTVSVSDGRLFTMGYDTGSGEDVIYCVDARTGEVKWTHRYPAPLWARFHTGGTLSTPSVDGERVFTSNREGNMFCFEAATGNIVWHRNLKEDFNLTYPQWGFAASPFIVKDMIVLNVGVVLALDKDSGDEIWRTKENYGDAYSTPVDFDLGGAPSLAVFNKTGLVFLDRTTGDEWSRLDWRNRPNVNAASPVVIDDKVFISSGYNRGCALVDVSEKQASIVWENKSMRNKMSGCVLWNDHLYGFDESMLKCIDLEGNERWRQRGLGMGSLIIADGKLIAMSAKGELVIAEATPDAYHELSRTKVLEGGRYWTTPVLSDGFIYCRNSNGDLVCRDHRSGSALP